MWLHVVTCGYMWLHTNHSESCTCRNLFDRAGPCPPPRLCSLRLCRVACWCSQLDCCACASKALAFRHAPLLAVCVSHALHRRRSARPAATPWPVRPRAVLRRRSSPPARSPPAAPVACRQPVLRALSARLASDRHQNQSHHSGRISISGNSGSISRSSYNAEQLSSTALAIQPRWVYLTHL